MRPVLIFSALALATLALHAQNAAQSPVQPNAQPDPPHREWKASWITHPTAPLREPLVLHFRRTLSLAAVPATYPVRVSADNRFILFVNGHRVGDGPARGDLAHWRYERFDLAPLLQPGQNLISATVWNFGVYAPVAQFTDRTAFLLESEAGAPSDRSSSLGWEASGDTPSAPPMAGWWRRKPGQRPLDRSVVGLRTYMASGPGEEIDAAHYDWAWNDPSAAASSWVPAASPMRESLYSTTNEAHSFDVEADNPWGLVPDKLPPMELLPASPGEIVRVDLSAPPTVPGEAGRISVPVHSKLSDLKAFPAAPVSVPAGAHVYLILDRKTLTTAYPRLTVSGGKGAEISLTYAEALYDKDKHKGDRDDVDDRAALGLTDGFLPDGGAHRSFEPLWWRTWRYLDWTSKPPPNRCNWSLSPPISPPILLSSAPPSSPPTPSSKRSGRSVGGPRASTPMKPTWTRPTTSSSNMWATPASRPSSPTPSPETTVSPARLSRPSTSPASRRELPTAAIPVRWRRTSPPSPCSGSAWFTTTGCTGPTPGRRAPRFPAPAPSWPGSPPTSSPTACSTSFPGGASSTGFPRAKSPPTTRNGESCVTTLQYLGALNDAADLENALGDPLLATRYQDRAGHVRSGLYDKCWSASRGLLPTIRTRRTSASRPTSWPSSTMWFPKTRQQEILRKMLAIDPGATPGGVLSASYYFRFYLARALEHAGMADEYLNSIDPWRKLLALHFSTWPEVPGITRSDSHAWSAHPIYDLLTLVAGIQPASPGFATVDIAPHLGNLPSLKASYPHPQGMIEVEYQRQGDKLDATITLPGTLTGYFVYGKDWWPLQPGMNHIQAPRPSPSTTGKSM